MQFIWLSVKTGVSCDPEGKGQKSLFSLLLLHASYIAEVCRREFYQGQGGHWAVNYTILQSFQINVIIFVSLTTLRTLLIYWLVP